MALHDRAYPLEVSAQFAWTRLPLDRRLQVSQQMRDHRVVLFQIPQRVPKLGMRRRDRREQRVIFTLVMFVERGAETVTEQQQVTRRRFRRFAAVQCGPSCLKGLTQSLMGGA